MKKRRKIKILAIADMHWYTDEELNRIKSLDFDICVLLGDINQSVIRFIKRCCGDKPLLAVAGNHDEWNTPDNAGVENVHCKCNQNFITYKIFANYLCIFFKSPPVIHYYPQYFLHLRRYLLKCRVT